MQITAEMIAERLAGLRSGRERLRADLLTTDGAIQDCEYWMAQLAEEAESSEEPDKIRRLDAKAG